MAPPRGSYGEFIGQGWRSGPVRRASSFTQRWRGLSYQRVTAGLWLLGTSVHGFGMVAPLWVCGLDAGGVVVDVKRLVPGRLLAMRRAKSVVELPISVQPPPVGMVLTWLDAGNTDPLRDPDRQSR